MTAMMFIGATGEDQSGSYFYRRAPPRTCWRGWAAISIVMDET